MNTAIARQIIEVCTSVHVARNCKKQIIWPIINSIHANKVSEGLLLSAEKAAEGMTIFSGKLSHARPGAHNSHKFACADVLEGGNHRVKGEDWSFSHLARQVFVFGLQLGGSTRGPTIHGWLVPQLERNIARGWGKQNRDVA